jgi:oligopeptide/dipeptide ABC transporter ATP-binding protein
VTDGDAGNTILTVEQLSVGFREGREPNSEVIRNLSLTVAGQEVLGVVGASGSGKSILARSVLGLVRTPPGVVRGSIRLHGQEMVGLSESAVSRLRGQQMSLIVSNARARLNPLISVGDQVARAVRGGRHLGNSEARVEALHLLEAVGMPDPRRRFHALPEELSGGMCQRVVIALGIANEPRLIVADEPTNGLDVTVQAQVLKLIREIMSRRDAGMLLMTRDMGVVAHYCDRVAVLDHGEIVEVADVASFFRAPQHARSRALLDAAFASRGAEGTEARKFGRLHSGPADLKPGGEVLLEVRDLVKHFPIRGDRHHVVHAVNGASFQIREGETLALVGESGSGKTTVGRSILGLSTLTSGEILFRGRDLGSLSKRELGPLRPQIQAVFQDPRDSLDPQTTVAAVVGEPLRGKEGWTRIRREERIREVLQLVSLPPDVASQRPGRLSSGAQQRVAIARALASQPNLIVLDEPTSELDVSVRAEIVHLLVAIQQQLGTSYLFISHDITAARELSHRIAIMYLGEIVEIGRSEDIYREQLHPYGKVLLGSVLFPDPSEVVGQVEARGEIPSPVDLPTGCFFHPRCAFAIDRCAVEHPRLSVLAGEEVACWRAPELLSSERRRAGDGKSGSRVEKEDGLRGDGR